MTTKIKISDQILYKLYGGYPDNSAPVQREDVIEAVNQKINALLKTQHFSVTLPTGETIPDGLLIGTYPAIDVASLETRSSATLPAIPVSLPRNMGVLEVSPDEDFSNLYIPLQPGQYALLKNQPLISSLLNQVGYEVYGSKLMFTKDITADGISKIYTRLAIHDISKYDDYEPLPIPADLEAQIVEEVYKGFADVHQIPDKQIVDNFNPNPKGGNI